MALVTGASAGIGWVVCQTLAAAGMRVVAVARRRDRLEALQQDLVSSGIAITDFLPIVCDISKVRAVCGQLGCRPPLPARCAGPFAGSLAACSSAARHRPSQNGVCVSYIFRTSARGGLLRGAAVLARSYHQLDTEAHALLWAGCRQQLDCLRALPYRPCAFEPSLCVQEAEVVAVPRIIAKRWPGQGIDVLVNNAGLGRNNASLCSGVTSSWVEMISTNVLGLCMFTRAAVQVCRPMTVRVAVATCACVTVLVRLWGPAWLV